MIQQMEKGFPTLLLKSSLATMLEFMGSLDLSSTIMARASSSIQNGPVSSFTSNLEAEKSWLNIYLLNTYSLLDQSAKTARDILYHLMEHV